MASLLIKISPSIHPAEKPIVLTLWKQGIEVKQINPELVHVYNATQKVMPILFYVGISDDTQRWLHTIRQLLQEKI